MLKRRGMKYVLTVGGILLLLISGAMAQMPPGAREAARACRPDIAVYVVTFHRDRAVSKPA